MTRSGASAVCVGLVTGLLLVASSGGCCKRMCSGGSGSAGGSACNLSLVNDTASACPGTETKIAASIPVLANDNLAGGTATVTISAQGTQGTAVVNGNNTITYAATNPASTGQDTFTYQVSTGASCTRTATVTVLLDTDTPSVDDFTAPSVVLSANASIPLASHVTPATAGLTYAIDTSSTLGAATVDPATGVVSYTAPASVPGGGTPTVITGVTATASSADPGRDAANCINGSDFANFTTIGTGNVGTGDNGAEWNTSDPDPSLAQNPSYLGWITFDLGAVYDVSRFQVWNWNNGPGTRGIKDVSVQVSQTDSLLRAAIPSGAGITTLGSPTVFPQETGNGTVFNAPFTARYVRFNGLSNYETNGATRIGLAEVRFEGAAAQDSGTDTFTYTVTDACGNTSAAGTVTIPIVASEALRLAAAAPTAQVLIVNESSAEIAVFVGGVEVDVVQPRGTTIAPRNVAAGTNQEIRVEALSALPASNGSTTATADLEADETYTITYTDTGDGNRTIQVEEQ